MVTRKTDGDFGYGFSAAMLASVGGSHVGGFTPVRSARGTPVGPTMLVVHVQLSSGPL
jgi:hypothetical protein